MAEVTIASETVPNWQGNTTGVTLRIYCNSDFTASDGTFVPKSIRSNWAGLGTFYESGACTVSSGSLVIPAVTLESTTDSLDNPTTTYSAVLWDSISGLPIQNFGTYACWSLASTPTSTTWGAVFVAEYSGLGTYSSLTTRVTINVTASAPGAFHVAHGVTSPKFAILNMTSGGQIWWQSPMFDGTYLYLVASDTGLTATVTVFY